MQETDEPESSVPERNKSNKEGIVSLPGMRVEAQYIKDLSFENPLNPVSSANSNTTPDINVDVTTGGRSIGENRYEISLQIRAAARAQDTTLFILELTYSAVISTDPGPEEVISAILMIQGAQLIFPFARNVIADVTREGGFPPLYLQPIDFAELYQNQQSKTEE